MLRPAVDLDVAVTCDGTPCTLSGAESGAVTVDKLPASGLVLTGTAIEPPPD